MNALAFITNLFEIRAQAHHLHHITASYAEHKALGAYYEGIDGLMDDFVETYQGKYGRVKGDMLLRVDSGMNAVDYIKAAIAFLSNYKEVIAVEDIDLQNIIADMIGLSNKTLYLLTLK